MRAGHARWEMQKDEIMKNRVSALMDGELEDHEIDETLQALRRRDDLRTAWSDAQVIGSVLRKDGAAAFDVSAQVMSALELEPTVLAPRSRRVEWRRPALALAASAAGIALVSSLAMSPGVTSSPAVVTAVSTNKPAQNASASSRRMQEYWVAHQAYAPASGIGGGAHHIRTVAVTATGGEGRKE